MSLTFSIDSIDGQARSGSISMSRGKIATPAFMPVGTAATAGLEVLAEGGDNSDLISEADGDANVLATGSGAAPIGPAGSETVTITVL